MSDQPARPAAMQESPLDPSSEGSTKAARSESRPAPRTPSPGSTGSGTERAVPSGTPIARRAEALEQRSMLGQARRAARDYGAQARFWRRPYARTQPLTASAIAPVWITTYPASIIAPDGQSVLSALGDPVLWQALSSIGIRAIHTGPTKLAGGLTDGVQTPTVDGSFDRIGFDTDPVYGTQEQFKAISRMAAAHNAVVIDDVIPSHTGKGPDFELALARHQDWPGLYHMVEIDESDWHLLPDLPEGEDAVNLSAPVVDALVEKEYIVGHLQRVIFFEPGVKETDWSATGPVTGVDGQARRWVYLHYFKAGQPSLNWLDPSFAAQQLVAGDAMHSLDVLGARGLRLDANGFLGIERRPGDAAWSESHPLSVTGNQLLGGMIRKAGGFSFQELNLTVDDIAAMSGGGADLSYDFITRPAYHHALVSGDAGFLRLMLRTVHEHEIDPASLIHALQNHDELTLELVHFWTLHADDVFTLGEQTWQGRTLRTFIRETMYEALSGPRAEYNLRFVTNGVSCTTASVITAALGIEDVSALDEQQIVRVRQAHLLLVMYNAFQPGVFALSGWDLVGALPLPAESVAHLMDEGDTRWINRGAYDLIDAAPDATHSGDGIPRATTLYGPITTQLQDPDSFVSQLKGLLAIREAYGIAASRQILLPDTPSPGLLVMVHELPNEGGTQITALNFGTEPIDESVELPGVASGAVVDLVAELVVSDFEEEAPIRLVLEPLSGQLLRIVHAVPT